MLKLYYASAIDVNPIKAFETIKKFKEIFTKFPIEVYGAGIGNSPIIDPSKSTWSIQRIITAYDLRIIRECDAILVITDSKTYAAGTYMELEYARQLGLMTIILCLSKELKNIFPHTMTDRVIYSVEELEALLKEISEVMK